MLHRLHSQHYQILWQAINNQGNAISDLNNRFDDLELETARLDDEIISRQALDAH